MAIDHILLGDDNIEFAKNAMPYIPNAEIEYADNPKEVIRLAKTGRFSTVITDLNYTPNGNEGYKVLTAIKKVECRKILWTGNASEAEVQQKARKLGAELLDKNELGTLVGMSVAKAPVKRDGIVLIYCNNGVFARAIKQSVGLLFSEDKFAVCTDVKQMLPTGKYGLVIDTSTLPGADSKGNRTSSTHGSVAHDMKYVQLAEVPRVVCVYNRATLLVDITVAVNRFYAGR